MTNSTLTTPYTIMAESGSGNIIGGFIRGEEREGNLSFVIIIKHNNKF